MLVGLEQGLLNYVRRINLVMQSGFQAQPGQNAEVFPVVLQRKALRSNSLVHDASYE
jgi:hypothetical protein